MSEKVQSAIDKAREEAIQELAGERSKIPCTLVGPVRQSAQHIDELQSTDPEDLVRYHIAMSLQTDGEDGLLAVMVKRVPSGHLTQPDTYLYEVRDHLGHAIASGTCDRFDFALLCADSALYQFGYLEEDELPKSLEIMSFPVAGTLPADTVRKLIAGTKDDRMPTVGEVIKLPYTVLSRVLTEGDVMAANKALAKATTPKGIVQLLIPDAASTSGNIARAASHRTHGNPYLPVLLQRLNTVRRRIALHTGSQRGRKALLKEHSDLTDALYQVHGPTVSPDFLASFLPDSPLTDLLKESTMGNSRSSDPDYDPDLDNSDEELGLLERIMKDPTIMLALDGGLSGGKMVGAVKAQRLFQHIARKIAAKFVGEQYIGVLDTPGGDILVSLCMPLAVHAVATKAPLFGVKVPGARPLAAISDAAFRGQIVRVGLQYAPELTDVYDMVADELKELRELGSALLGPEEEAPAPGLPDHADADAIASLAMEREKQKVGR